MIRNERPFSKNAEAVAEVMGEILLTAIAVIAFSVIAVFIFSYADPEEKVYTDIDGWINVDADTIVLRHAGGEVIDIENTQFLFKHNGKRWELSANDIRAITGTDRWQLGDLITINASTLWNTSIDQNDTISAAIIHKDANMVIQSGTLLGIESTTGTGNISGNMTPPQPPGPTIPNDQIAWWKLNENTGTLATDSIGGYDGTITGASWDTGVNDSALLLDGTSDYGQVNQKIISGYPFTVSAWVKTTDSGSDQAIVNLARSNRNNRYYGTYVNSGGNAALVARSGSNIITTGTVVNDGQWHNIVGVFNSNRDRSLYVDGVLNGTSTSSVGFHTRVDRWSIGRLGSSSQNAYLDGSVDEIKLWDRALNASEVQLIYLNP